MKRGLCLLFFLVISFSANLDGQSVSLVNLWDHWSSGTAHSLPAGRFEMGLFQPMRYGCSDALEFSAHPLLFFVSPNFDAKINYGDLGGITIASSHGLTYPTHLMRLVAKEGIGGLISPEFDIPHIISWQNELLISAEMLGSHLLTAKLAWNTAYKSGPLDPRTTIDLPVVYARTGVYYHDYGWRFGADLKGPLFWRWGYSLDGDVFYYPKADPDINMAFEHKGLLFWNKSTGFQLCLGYLLSYGEYPFGTQWHILPLIDLQWGWTRGGRR